MKNCTYKLASILILCTAHVLSLAQSAEKQIGNSSPNADISRTELQQKLGRLSTALTETREQLENSQRRVELLQLELQEIQKQLNPSQDYGASDDTSSTVQESPTSETAVLTEQQDVLKAQVKLLDQSKVESESKYLVRLTGLILFNAFANDGVVDNLDLPEVALRPTPGVSHGSVGGGMRQTIIGIKGIGPRVLGARTFADVNLDFFGGLSYGNFGTSSGSVRMRTASVNMEWQRYSVQAGMVGPLISPLSPTSYATVAQPGMAWAGNLWTWAPQLRFEHRIPLTQGRHVGLEFGLWDAPSAGFSTNELVRQPTPGELSKQPAYEGRLSFGGNAGERRLQLGVGGYYNRESYSGGQSVDSWAATGDWVIPITSRFELSGEGYRGRALGGLGGGVYKDVVTGTDPLTGATAMRALNAIGGWNQFKTRFGQIVEANAVIGQDSGFASDFHMLVLPIAASQSQLRARNRMVVGNIIFRPKSYLIFSPEYRRIWTWPINSTVNTANIFTLTVGYQF